MKSEGQEVAERQWKVTERILNQGGLSSDLHTKRITVAVV
jgi:hypothetical protein